MSVVYNNTHYYSYNNKILNSFPSTNSWEFESSKRLSFGQRLYWEYKYCKSVGGQAFFYTFTYNDESLPHYKIQKLNDQGNYEDYLFPCFNYEHIRLLTNGFISKVLRRKYGSQLRYFVACERGEGKGRHRKKGYNPHYHVIFFVFPLSDDIRKDTDVPYKRISPIQFCHLCKCVWQYKSVHDRSYKKVSADYRSARFGHCQPGDNVGLIVDFDALSYVSKYVVKDCYQFRDDMYVKSHFEHVFKELGYTWHSVYYYYQYLRMSGRCFDREDFLKTSGLSEFMLWRSCMSAAKLHFRRHSYDFFTWLERNYSKDSDIWKFWDQEFADFFQRVYVPHALDHCYRDYVCKFGAKVRCSKSLGIYGLQFVKDDLTDPHFVLNKSDEVVAQPIALYYYRKLYMNTEYCPQSGNILYVLNDKGVQLKCNQLETHLNSNVTLLNESLNFAFSNIKNEDFISTLWLFDLNWSDIQNAWTYVTDYFYRSFSVYRTVYQYRSFSVLDDCPSLSEGLDLGSILPDYEKFLRSNFYTCDYQLSSITSWISTQVGRVMSFDSHPVFAPFIHYFDICNKIIDCVLSYKGNLKRKVFAESQELRQSINALKFSFCFSDRLESRFSQQLNIFDPLCVS